LDLLSKSWVAADRVKLNPSYQASPPLRKIDAEPV
jgi:hypothetical protein